LFTAAGAVPFGIDEGDHDLPGVDGEDP